ncbi:MAG: proteasome accessory factor PafA2 [Demequinaceae bacterium]|nr:proteasome accessory factor PafA2 [Demequinaceae bacterium]
MRVVGIETEYGVTDRNDPGANPILLSSALVASYRASVGSATAHWDYGGEDPLNDLRGLRRSRETAHPDLLTDEPEAYITRRRRRGQWEDPAHLNAVLPNGARLYVDHAHPEYSGPEVTSATDAIVWDKAGDEVMREASVAAATEGFRIALYKNNVDGKGSSYGTHENFLVDRAVPFEDLARRISSHLVTRQVYTGAGRVGLGQRGETPGFQISQRSDYIEEEVGLETTLRRPIVNTRDEPHANPARWRRLHIILGDANCLEVPTFLKIGTTSLVLNAIEAGDDRLDGLVLDDPVGAVHAVSRDLSLSQTLRLASGGETTALGLQRALIQIVGDHASDEEDSRVIERWGAVLDGLERDPLSCGRQVEWVAKLNLLSKLRGRLGVADDNWDDPSLAAADIRWSDLDPGEGLYNRLAAADSFDMIAAGAEVASAVTHPPQDTRATLRGRMVGHRADIVDAAGWSTVVLDRQAEHGDLEVIHLDDPFATSHPLLDELLAP